MELKLKNGNEQSESDGEERKCKYDSTSGGNVESASWGWARSKYGAFRLELSKSAGACLVCYQTKCDEKFDSGWLKRLAFVGGRLTARLPAGYLDPFERLLLLVVLLTWTRKRWRP